MSANAQVTPDFDGPEDRQLADDIARAMQHRPLMKRLARVGASHGGAAEFVAKSAAQAAPNSAAHAATTSAPAEMPHLTADPRSIEELIDDLGHVAASPPSAAWLENARRAHRQAQVTHAVAWVTTLAIAVSIIGVALLLLRA